MPLMRSHLFLIVCIVFGGVLFASPSVWACRFNVRDVGFVQLDSSPYHFYGYYNDTVPEERKSLFQQIAFSALLDSNIELELVHTQRDSKHAALNFIPPFPLTDLPLSSLVSSNGRFFSIPLNPGSQPLKQSLWDSMDRIVFSPLREAMALDSIRNYGVILMVEGEDEAENKRDLEIIKQAIQQVKNNLTALPKIVERPPVLHVLSRKDFERESILLWSLGIDPNDVQTHVAVIYGRLRMIGSLLSGGGVTKDSLSSVVSVIGLSCECGLDRNWMMGTMLPFRWTDRHKDEMAQRLGFDPDSPLVKTEIAQILSNSAAGRRETARGDRSSDALMGYGEFTVSIDSSMDDDLEGHTLNVETSSSPVASLKNESVFQYYRGVFIILGSLVFISCFGALIVFLKARSR